MITISDRVVVVGGGWAGCAAALMAAKKGSQVTLLEKNDRLLGYGLVAGEVYHGGRLTICLEAQAMGGREIFAALERVARYRGLPLSGLETALIYDVWAIEEEIARILRESDVQVRLETRVREVIARDGEILSLVLDNGEQVTGKVFVDATGSAGPASLCNKYGWGCVACINRCHVFGSRISLAGKMGVQEGAAIRPDGRLGGTGQGVNILKESLDPGLVRDLEKDGFLVIPVPADFSQQSFELPKTDLKTLKENLVLVDNGMAKAKSRPHLPLQKLRQLPGFQKAVYFDPVGGSKGNCVRFLAVTPRENSLLVKGTRNLFVAGEKQGLLVGCSEAIVSGLLAGLNAHRLAREEDPLVLPRSTAIGEMLAFTGELLENPEGYKKRYSCNAGVLGQRFQERGLYTLDEQEVEKRISSLGLENVF
ncbi:MAG: FAD-dependent oxidoreductase [Clostridia bacterium]|nr:FAD-dependent oxidoreductase [Clostridia bacterium]